jgi:hypothetical protein
VTRVNKLIVFIRMEVGRDFIFMTYHKINKIQPWREKNKHFFLVSFTDLRSTTLCLLYAGCALVSIIPKLIYVYTSPYSSKYITTTQRIRYNTHFVPTYLHTYVPTYLPTYQFNSIQFNSILRIHKQ